MSRDFKLMVLANAIFISIYFWAIWAEYSGLRAFSQSSVAADFSYIVPNFPWRFQIIAQPNKPQGGIYVFEFDNWAMIIFLLAIVVNLYFLFRLQKHQKA